MSRLNIALAGIMGSGKTTLARKLSAKLNMDYVPESLDAKKYLQDLFDSTKRWALETQIAFLVNKSTAVLDSVKKNHNFILDRTFYEDIEIFAKNFYNNHDIDERGYNTYKALATHYLAILPSPDIIIYCNCDLNVSKERIKLRNRDFQLKYPENHIEDIYSLYVSWLKKFNIAPLYEIDTVINDVRDDNIIKDVINEINHILIKSNTQLDLFESVSESRISILKERIPYDSNSSPKIQIKSYDPGDKILTSNYAYIAAPFTSIANEFSAEENTTLFDFPISHGTIPSGDLVRKLLLDISKILSGQGIDSLIPHRDINKWGKVKLSPDDVFSKCTYYVKHCDLFIGLLSESLGAHMEFGLALGLSKPLIIFECDEIVGSYISKGISNLSSNTTIIKVKKVSEISKKLASIDLTRFIEKY